jgi:HEAT repeat protein
VSGTTLALDVHACALAEVLALIAAETGVRITTAEGLSAQPLSLRTEPQSIETALRQLLRNTDTFILYTPKEDGPRLTAVWVYPPAGARDVRPVAPGLWASTRELASHLADPDAEVRGDAIEELIQRNGQAALPQALSALADENSRVRQRALDAALEAELHVPLPQLEALALADPSPEVRLRALQAAEERPDASAIIRAAQNDPDPLVRREALTMSRRVKHK